MGGQTMDLTEAIMNRYAELVERLTDALRLRELSPEPFATVQEAFASDLRDETNSKRNILGLGYGEKLAGGEPQGVLSIGIYVVRKAPANEVHSDFLAASLVQRYLGSQYLSDVIEVGRPKLLHHATRAYPIHIPGGAAISGATFVNHGTLGGWLTDETKGNFYLLSCWHCIDGTPSGGKGKDVYQPGRGNPIAQITASIDPTTPFGGTTIDACIAKLDDPQRMGEFILRLGEIRRPQKVWKTYQQVCKSGASTHRTVGTIVQIGGKIDFYVPPLGRDVLYENQLLIQPYHPVGPFASPGDSGSLVVMNESGDENRVVGLLVGGDDAPPNYFATPILDVVAALQSHASAFNALRSLSFIEYP
jgi:hypothetical protein